MEASSYLVRTFLRRALTKSSHHGARELHRTDGEWKNHRLVGLLRRTDLPAHNVSFVFYGVGRTLNSASSGNNNQLLARQARQAQFPKKFGISRIAVQILQLRIGLD